MFKLGSEYGCHYRRLDPYVLTMHVSEKRHGSDLSYALNGSSYRCILPLEEVSPRFIIVGGVCAKDAAEVRLAECDSVVNASSANRAY